MMEENETSRADMNEDVTKVYKRLSDKFDSIGNDNDKQDKNHDITQQGKTDVNVEENIKKDSYDITQKDKVAVIDDEMKKDGKDGDHKAKKYGDECNTKSAVMHNDKDSTDKLENELTSGNTLKHAVSKKIADVDNKNDVAKYNDGISTIKLGDCVHRDDDEGDNGKPAIIHNDKDLTHHFEDGDINNYDADMIKKDDDKDATDQHDNDAGAAKKVGTHNVETVTAVTQNGIGDNGSAQMCENEADVQKNERHNDNGDDCKLYNEEHNSKLKGESSIIMNQEIATPQKRSRGRPSNKQHNLKSEDKIIDQGIATSEKRSRGRPRKQHDLESEDRLTDQGIATPQKRSRGRPPKSKQHNSESEDESSVIMDQGVATSQKRSRGRPKKNEDNSGSKEEHSEIMDQEIETPQKRCRGRPKGSAKKKAVTPAKGRSSRPGRVCTENVEYVYDEDYYDSS